MTHFSFLSDPKWRWTPIGTPELQRLRKFLFFSYLLSIYLVKLFIESSSWLLFISFKMLVKLLLWYCWWYYTVCFFPNCMYLNSVLLEKKILLALKFWKKVMWRCCDFHSHLSYHPEQSRWFCSLVSSHLSPLSLDATMMLSATEHHLLQDLWLKTHTHAHMHTRARACPIRSHDHWSLEKKWQLTPGTTAERRRERCSICYHPYLYNSMHNNNSNIIL